MLRGVERDFYNLGSGLGSRLGSRFQFNIFDLLFFSFTDLFHVNFLTYPRNSSSYLQQAASYLQCMDFLHPQRIRKRRMSILIIEKWHLVTSCSVTNYAWINKV